MFRKLVVVGLASFLLVSCSSNSKKGESGSDGTQSKMSGERGSNVTDKDMNFSPEGSDSGAIEGLSTVNFEYDKSRLTTSARRILAENANWIKENKGTNVQIEGHCDERGSIEYNLSLGERRAESVKRYLVNLGVNAKQLSVISYGKEKLLSRGDSEDDHARNRRANFVPIPR